MVFKIHKNIKSSLRETIKGRDPRSTSNTILSCAPRSIRPPSPASPPLLPFLCQIFSPPFLRSFPSFPNHSYCWNADLYSHSFILHLSHGRLFVVSRAMCGYQKQTLFPVEMFSGEEEGLREQAPV